MIASHPEVRLRLLQELSRDLPDDLAGLTVSVHWENGDRSAGVATTDKEAVVFFAGAETPVDTLAQAQALLRRIFADEVVAVTGYDREQFQFCRLVPSDAIAGGLPARNHHEWTNVISCDHLVVVTWSRGMLPANSDG
ncbi:MAG TPA: hypothetical protein VM915_06075 [Verrucomicrobiae bacterium]|nr:hypothetical protein [Verrucomicrobiae bacterium]